MNDHCRHLVRFILLSAIFFLPIHYCFALPISVPDSGSTSKRTADPSHNDNKLFWFTIGGGVIGPGVGGDLKATYAWGMSSFSAKVCGAGEISIFGPSGNEVIEYGLYYGMQKYNDWGLLRLAVGPSYFTGVKNHTDYLHLFGVGAEAEAMLKFEFIGLSIMGNIMASPKFFYGGVTLNLSLGKLH